MLFEQQSQAGYGLSMLESKVSGLRKEFTNQMLRKNYWESEESIGKLFKAGASAEVQGIMNKFEKRNFEN